MIRAFLAGKSYDVFVLVCVILAITFFIMAGKSYIEKPVAAAQTSYSQSLEYERQKWLLSQTIEKVKKVEIKVETLNDIMTKILVESKYQSALLGWILAGFGVLAIGALTIIMKFSDKVFNKEVKEK